MARFKPDSSFFKKIVTGANGTRAICRDLAQHGHDMVELERGSTGAKLWKDVKRKRVRLPDLVCRNCGVRVECRTKTKPELSMSHSETDQERSWDFGMLPEDWIAFPISIVETEDLWTRGRLQDSASYWHERQWAHWSTEGRINYFTVDAFRRCRPDKLSRKGVTEGSELTLAWSAKFATCSGTVDSIENGRIKLRPANGRLRTLSPEAHLTIHVAPGQQIEKYQILASGPTPLTVEQVRCSNALPADFIQRSLKSRERTVRFTGVKLCRIHGAKEYVPLVKEMANDPQEDLYVRLEALAYLASIGDSTVDRLFREHLTSSDDQIRLESVITIGEIGTAEAVQVLGNILHDNKESYFLRSASAWSLGMIGTLEAQIQLKAAFTDVNWDIREEALEALSSLGDSAYSVLMPGLREEDEHIAAGCAETIRQVGFVSPTLLTELSTQLKGQAPPKWVVWLAGHLPSRQASETLESIQDTNPQVYYAVNLLWSFTRSWIARRWELQAGISEPNSEV